jgi:hypothetical protein
MRRFCASPGERVELIPSFNNLVECAIHGFAMDDPYLNHPIEITFLLTPEELIRLAEACRMAALDATTSTAED